MKIKQLLSRSATRSMISFVEKPIEEMATFDEKSW